MSLEEILVIRVVIYICKNKNRNNNYGEKFCNFKSNPFARSKKRL